MRTLAACFFLAVLLCAPARGEEPVAVPLERLQAGHPRLSLTTGRLAAVRALLTNDPVAARAYEGIRRKAGHLLDDPVSVYEKPDGKRLLHVSRRVLDRVSTLAFARWMEKDRRFADRAWQELDAVAAFPDWNPSHFLDTAEMTRAVALGYDWLYADWTPAQRERLERAILELGLKPGLQAFEAKAFWVTCDHNWNQVCHGGLGIGALAIADRHPAEARAVLEEGLRRIPTAAKAYGPDGAGIEGPTYWTYGCGYHVAYLDALQTALGSDLGLGDIPELGLSGAFQIYLSGAGRRVAFDFEDCGSAIISAPAHYWLARRFNEPAYAWIRHQALAQRTAGGEIWDLLWHDPRGARFDPASLPLDRHFRHAECASMRSSWTDPDALVLAFQGGDNTFNHWHLDIGSFILEAQGERWIIDSGIEKQTYQAHKHKLPRWSFYRVRAEGHNTLVLNPAASTNAPDQHPKGRAAITDFQSGADGARAVVDMTSAYEAHARSVRRTFELAERRTAVVVTDVIVADRPADLWWFAHTEAEVTLAPDARAALLTRAGKQFSVRLESPEEARFAVMEARPLPGSPDPDIQDRNANRRKLAIHLEGVTNSTLRVRFGPL